MSAPVREEAVPSGVGRLLTARIAGAAGLVALGAFGSRLLGLVRDPLSAYFFGRTASTDSYFVAASLSTLVYDLLVSGLVGAALIPVFSRLAGRERRQELMDVAGTIFAVAAVVLAGVVLLLMLLAPDLVYLMDSGAAPGVRGQAVLLARVMLPTVLFMGMSAICTALLYSLHDYRYGALSVVCINFGVVVGLLLLHRLGIVSAAIGLLAGSLAQFAVQLVGLGRAGVYPRLNWHLRHPEVVRTGLLYAPVAVSFLLTGAITVIDRNLYSHVGTGALSASQYATRLVQVPLGLVATALSMAILPTLSRYAELADLAPYKRMVATGVTFATLLMLPATIGLVVLRTPALALLFQRGHFGVADTRITALAFLLYAPQMPFAAVDQVLIAAFYARRDTTTPVAVMFFSAGVYLVVAFGLVAQWGLAALVLATTLQNCAHAIVLWWLLNRRLGAIGAASFGPTLVRIALASAAMGLVCLLASHAVALWPHLPSVWRPPITLVVAGGLGCLVYTLLLWKLQIAEARLAWSLVSARISRSPMRG